MFQTKTSEDKYYHLCLIQRSMSRLTLSSFVNFHIMYDKMTREYDYFVPTNTMILFPLICPKHETK